MPGKLGGLGGEREKNREVRRLGARKKDTLGKRNPRKLHHPPTHSPAHPPAHPPPPPTHLPTHPSAHHPCTHPPSLWEKSDAGCGSKPVAPPILEPNWDVHCGYRILTHSWSRLVLSSDSVSGGPTPALWACGCCFCCTALALALQGYAWRRRCGFGSLISGSMVGIGPTPLFGGEFLGTPRGKPLFFFGQRGEQSRTILGYFEKHPFGAVKGGR